MYYFNHAVFKIYTLTTGINSNIKNWYMVMVYVFSLQDIMETTNIVAYKENVIISYLAFHML